MKSLFLFVNLTVMMVSCLLGIPLEGRVVDGEGKAIAYVRVQVDEGKQFVLTNEAGYFSLDLPRGKHHLLFQHINYFEKELTVDLQTPEKLIIRLVINDLQLEAIQIQAGKRDPAYAIMEQLIANKKNFLRQFEGYQRETYLKATLEKDTLKRKPFNPFNRQNRDSLMVDSLIIDSLPTPTPPTPTDTLPYFEAITFVETQFTTYFSFPRQFKTIVNAYRDYVKDQGPSKITIDFGLPEGLADYETENDNPYLFYMDPADAEFNFYRNLIEAPGLGDRPFISPLNNTNWRLVYKYKLLERYYENKRVHYRIQITPRNQDGPYFQGEMIVIDGLWAIKELDFAVLPSTLSYFKAFQLAHHYEATEDGRWVIREENYRYQIKEGPSTIKGETLAQHSEYQLDPDFPKNFFKNELRRTDREAFEKDSSYWASVRPLELDNKVNQLIHDQDSIIAYRKSPEYLAEQDSIYNHLAIEDFLLNGITWRNRARGMRYFVDPLIEQMQFFGVGGYRHQFGGTVRKTWEHFNQLSVGGDLSVGLYHRNLRGNGRVSYTYWPKRFGVATVRFGDNYTIVNPNQSITNMLSRSGFVRKVYGSIGNRIELANGLYLNSRVEFADRSMVDTSLSSIQENLLDFEDNTFLEFTPYREFLLDLKLSYTPGQKYQMEPFRKINLGSKWPTFSIHYKKAIKGIWGSEIDYDYLEFDIKQEMQLATLGTSRWEVTGGSFLNAANVPPPDYRYFRGSDPFIFANPLRNFQLLGNTFPTRDEFLRAGYLHNFEGTLLDKVPLLKRTPLQTTAGVGLLYLRDRQLFHSEAYVGIQMPFRIRRQRFKVGVFYVTDYGNFENNIENPFPFDQLGRFGQIKAGVSFYNPVKRQWSY